jgi:phosphate transport system substrate-binding protein
MNNMMTLWAETFRKFYPSVKIQVEGKGSSTAPPALIAGTAQFGPMSREMRATEIDQFEAKYGYKPTQLRTSYDALAIYVNKDNPIEKLTLAQADAIFSKTRKRGQKAVTTWGQLGLTGDWANKPISLYGRNSASGTYGYFKEHTLKTGDFKDTVKEQPGSASVVQGVTEDRYGIGYSGVGYRTSGVKAVALADETAAGQQFSAGSYEDVQAGKYPLARFLFIYVNKAPGKPLDPLIGEFVKLMFSKEGQEAVVKDGYMPLSAKLVQEELAKIAK